jgi:hypothetical protein
MVDTSPGSIPAAIAVAWTLVVLVGFSVLPFYSTSSGGESSDGTSFETTSEETIIEHEGTGVLAILLVPVAAALVGLAGAAFRIPAASVGAAGIAMALCLLGMASIGMFYLPAGILLVVAAVRSASARSEISRRRAQR